MGTALLNMFFNKLQVIGIFRLIFDQGIMYVLGCEDFYWLVFFMVVFQDFQLSSLSFLPQSSPLLPRSDTCILSFFHFGNKSCSCVLSLGSFWGDYETNHSSNQVWIYLKHFQASLCV